MWLYRKQSAAGEAVLTGKKQIRQGSVGVKEGSFYSGADPLKTGRLNFFSHSVEKGSYLPDFPSLYPA